MSNSITNQERPENENYKSSLRTPSRGENYQHNEGSMQQFYNNTNQYYDSNHFPGDLIVPHRDLSQGSVINSGVSHSYITLGNEQLQSVSDRMSCHNDNQNRNGNYRNGNHRNSNYRNGNYRNGNHRNSNQRSPSVERTSQISVASSSSQMSTGQHNIRIVKPGQNAYGYNNHRFGRP